MVPVLPFAVARGGTAVRASIAVGGAALFAIGAYKAKRTTGHVLRSALEMVAIGLASALAAWGIGALFGVAAPGP
jgi:predicted membrane protein (TIGR00267 family)